ncbi:ROK family transcriptional regulator [Solirubrobacter phytolaccae]|uniref:ROK family transcriptional regulator n=1 Tax=Solirubrobacter phytolaccae TaxID=1404360 RepID=A0A9X3NAH4_9ACTN|nr:ROK family transcriptional regulator [Solirubrobacter phytolaccae]MDA0181335.1 ROK family transcriptional regulator [Solirubrobacter phytolaccae]
MDERVRTRVRLLDAVLRHPECSRAELVSVLGLSRQTVTNVVAEAEEAGLVVQRPQLESEGPLIGRPPLRISLAPDAAFAIGLDIGRDQVRSAVCDLQGRVLSLQAEPTDLTALPFETFDRACELAHAALRDADVPAARVMGVGVGLPAPIDARTGTVHARDFLPAWRGIQPVAELRKRLQMSIRLTNDANAGAVGERLFGAARRISDALYIRLSAGIGVGLILDGLPYAGVAGIAGELGHTRVAETDHICRCGNRGCLELVASSVVVAERFSRSHGERVSVTELIELARVGDRSARRAIIDAADAVGRTLAGAVNLLNPQRVIVGGDLAAAGDILIEPLRSAVARGAVAPAVDTVEIVVGELGERAEVLGAAAMQLERAPAVLAARM